MHWRSSEVMLYLERVPWRALGRWWIVGLAFYVCGTATLWFLIQAFRMKLLLATLLAAEITLLVRFLINDRWVFNHSRPTYRRLWQYHVASAAGTAIWWAVTNILPKFGVHYIIAATVGTACSVFFAMGTNFLWIWHKGTTCSSFVYEQEVQAAKRELAETFRSTPTNYCGSSDT